MKLVDEIEFKKLLSNLKIEDTVAGGSVANSIVSPLNWEMRLVLSEK